MDKQTRLGLELFAAALLLGTLGDLLLRAAPWGLNACLWTGCLAATTYGLAYRWHTDLARAKRWFILPLCALALLFPGRDAALLKVVTAVGLLTALMASIQRAQLARLRLHESIAVDPPGLLGISLTAVTRLPRFLVRAIDWKCLSTEKYGKRAAAVARGLLLAAPVMAVFGALLVSADAVFENLVTRVFDIDLARLPGHLLWTLTLAWLVGSFLYGVLIKIVRTPEATDDTPEKKPLLALGIVEISVVLGLVNLLFVTFVLVQLSYLFGGYQTVLNTADLTLAQYARRGFFELVLVASLALPLLFGLRRLLAVKAGRSLRLFNIQAQAQVGLLFLILASAAQRMWLYQQTFGLTELRLYVSTVIVWLAFVLGWFLFTVLRDRAERFVPGAATAGFLVILGLHLINPDALIVKTNVARMQEGQYFDAVYLTGLSADAVPVLLDVLPSLSPDHQRQVARHLLARWHQASPPDWRTWSRARTVARRAVAARVATLQSLAYHPSAQPPPSPRNDEKFISHRRRGQQDPP